MSAGEPRAESKWEVAASLAVMVMVAALLVIVAIWALQGGPG